MPRYDFMLAEAWTGAPDVVRWAGVVVACLAALEDLRVRRLRNTLVLGVLLCGLVFSFGSRGGGGWASLAIAAALLVPLFGLAAASLVGGGDAKMIPAVSTLVLPGQTLDLIYAIALWGGGLGVLFMAARSLLARPALAGRFARLEAQTSQGLPFGVAIAAGLLTTLLAAS